MADETEDVIRASRALLGIVAMSMQSALEQVTLPQFRVLVLLVTLGPQRSGALGDRLDVVPSTITRVVDRLVKGGWAERTLGPEDRREVTVAATPAAHLLVREVTTERRRRFDRVLSAMQPEDRTALADTLRRFADIAGEPALDDPPSFGL
ncbi:MAG: MarR family transcriptional regulator [Acidobacteria bacterium]|nr:MarR family transcriptional regulator [Acidobacteriota bacterium]